MPYCNGMMLACINHFQDVLKCSVASLLFLLQVHVGSMLELLCSGQKSRHFTSLLLQTCLKYHDLEVPRLIGRQLRSVRLKHLCSQFLLVLSHELPAENKHTCFGYFCMIFGGCFFVNYGSLLQILCHTLHNCHNLI